MMTVSSRMMECVRVRGLIRMGRILGLRVAEISAVEAIMHDGVQTRDTFALRLTWRGIMLSWSRGVCHRPVLRGAVAGREDIGVDARVNWVSHEAQDMVLVVAGDKQIEDLSGGVDLNLLNDIYHQRQTEVSNTIWAFKLTWGHLLRPYLAHVRATGTLALHPSVSVRFADGHDTADRFDRAEELLVTDIAALLALVK